MHDCSGSELHSSCIHHTSRVTRGSPEFDTTTLKRLAHLIEAGLVQDHNISD